MNRGRPCLLTGLDIEDQKLAGLGQDRPSKSILVGPPWDDHNCSKAIHQCSSKAGADSWGGVSIEKPWERPKGHPSSI